MLPPSPDRSLPLPVTLVSLLLGLVGMNLAALLSPFGMRPTLLLGHTALLMPFVLSALSLRRTPREAFAVQPIGTRGVLLSTVYGAALWLASAGLLQLQYVLWPLPPGVLEFFERLHAKLELWPPWNGALSLLTIAIWPAITEEVVFRGALLGSLRRAGNGAAVALSAGLFALIHIPPGGYRVPFALALGLALGALRLRTESIVPAVVAHAVVNATTVAVTAQFGAAAEPTASASVTVAIGLLAFGTAAGAAAAFALRPSRAPLE